MTPTTVASSYTHFQETPAIEWVIPHMLGVYPIADVYVDSAGELQKIIPLEVIYVDPNTCRIEFSNPTAGFVTVV